MQLSARSSGATTFQINATAPPLVSASQALTVLQPPTSLAFQAALPPTLRAGTCVAASVEARHLGAAIAVASASTVALTVDLTDAARFFTDASCTTSTTSVTIMAGASTASVFIKPRSGVPMVLTATASFGAGTLSMTPVAIVRRGICVVRGSVESCPIDGSGTSPMVPATPGKSFVIAQSRVRDGTNAPLDVEARCRLQGLDVSCERRGSGLTADAETHFQVVELPTGLTVQTASSGNCNTTVSLPGPVDMGRSFVLKSIIGSGLNLDEDDSVSATLSSTTSVTLSSNACDGYEVQVVQLDGITVVRGVPILPAMPVGALTASATGLPASSVSTLVLSQPSTDQRFVGFPLAPCSVLARAEVSSPSELRFTRGMGRSACGTNTLARVPYERIDFGAQARVWSYTTTFSSNVDLMPVSISTVDPTRTFVLTSSQHLGGQGAGEADGTVGSSAPDGAVQTVLATNSRVEVIRGASNSAMMVTFYVVQLEP